MVDMKAFVIYNPWTYTDISLDMCQTQLSPILDTAVYAVQCRYNVVRLLKYFQ